MSVGRRRIRGTPRIVHIVSFSNWSNVVVTNTMPQVDNARRLRLEYSTCSGDIMSGGRRRIRGTRRIVHIVSFSNWSDVIVTKIVQVYKARRLSVHWKYCVSLHIISLYLYLCLFELCLCTYMCNHLHAVYVHHCKLYQICLQ